MEGGILCKLSGRTAAEDASPEAPKKSLKKFKKGLDKRERIWYLMQAVREGNGKEQSGGVAPKKSLKNFEKGLDKLRRTCYTTDCSASAACTL